MWTSKREFLVEAASHVASHRPDLTGNECTMFAAQLYGPLMQLDDYSERRERYEIIRATIEARPGMTSAEVLAFAALIANTATFMSAPPPTTYH